MLQFIKDLPEGVVGIRATGEVTGEDYEKGLIPKMEEFVARQGKVNYLLVLETDLRNFKASAWWEDFKLSLKNFTHWKKVAVVSDQKSIEWISDFFRHLIPGESRGYALSELEDAVRWVCGAEHDSWMEEISIEDVKDEIGMRSSNKGQGPSGENL
jgi:hypothetical protein